MLASIRLVPNLQCEYICHHVQKIVTKYQQEHPTDTDLYLVIDIKKPSDTNSIVPKIEYKNIEG